MKRCPQCNRLETDETLKFCRNDGALLVEDSSAVNESSATRILPISQPAEQSIRTDATSQATTSALDARLKSRAATEEAERRHLRLGGYVSEIKRHKIAALVALILVVAGVVGVRAYFRARSSEVTIESIAVLPFVNQNNDPNTEYLSDGITESIISSLAQLTKL